MQLRTDLIEEGLSEKRIDNIFAVLSKPLKYCYGARPLMGSEAAWLMGLAELPSRTG